MHSHEVNDDTIATLTELIPTDCWLMPGLDAFAQHLPPGGTDRGLSLRLRSALGLPPGGRNRSETPPVIIGSPRGRADIIVRANCRLHGGDRYLWRRYLPGTDHAAIERDAAAIIKQVYRDRLDNGARVEQAGTVRKAPAPPAPPARPASTSISRMPTPELQRLCADGLDELARRGDLPDPEPATPMTPRLTVEIAVAYLEPRLDTEVAPEVLRRFAAALQRHRDAAQAEMEAARAALEAAQAKLAGLG